ncbi:MAG: lipoate--protein ligase [Bacteriovoracales bacterium]|nr:lipoate--protein ligase [Bacteriovoracales bacterium]
MRTRDGEIKVVISKSIDPHWNLALEDALFSRLAPEDRVLLLWSNRPSVIIGRFQNPWVECHLENMEREGVWMARRPSGGGAVFQDLGNTNVSVMSGAKARGDLWGSRKGVNAFFLKALAHFGIRGRIGERNALWVEGRKVSGSAFRESAGKRLHHGTLLIRADLDLLARCLTPTRSKGMASKAVSSVESPVANVGELNPDIDHESFCRALIFELEGYGGRCRVLKACGIPEGPNRNEEFRSWEWRFGKTPPFEYTFPVSLPLGGDVRVRISARRGKMEEIVVERREGPLLPGQAKLSESLTRRVWGKAYDPGAVAKAFETVISARASVGPRGSARSLDTFKEGDPIALF